MLLYQVNARHVTRNVPNTRSSEQTLMCVYRWQRKLRNRRGWYPRHRVGWHLLDKNNRETSQWGLQICVHGWRDSSMQWNTMTCKERPLTQHEGLGNDWGWGCGFPRWTLGTVGMDTGRRRRDGAGVDLITQSAVLLMDKVRDWLRSW